MIHNLFSAAHSELIIKSKNRGVYESHTTLTMSVDDGKDNFLDALATATEAYPIRIGTESDS